MQGDATSVEYRRPGTPGDAAPGWTLGVTDRAIQLVSHYSASEKPDPIVCNFDTARCHTTLLGLLPAEGGISLPAILHLPGHGTFRVTGPGSLGYESGERLCESHVSCGDRKQTAQWNTVSKSPAFTRPWPASATIRVSMVSAATG